jgi:hypothetical protein
VRTVPRVNKTHAKQATTASNQKPSSREIEYRVVGITVRGSKAAVIARLLELKLPAERQGGEQ